MGNGALLNGLSYRALPRLYPEDIRPGSTSEVILTRRLGPSSSFIDCSVLQGSPERSSMKQKEQLSGEWSFQGVVQCLN